MKKIMILGAGIYQVPLIKKAKELNLYTIVCSKTGDYPGFSYSDKNYFVDTTNKEKILEIAKEENISAICTAGTDVAIPTIGYVCDYLGLPGLSYQDSINATNKKHMKETFVKNNITTANFKVAKDGKELFDKFKELNVEKAVVKIVDKSGSRGIITVNKNSNFNEVFDDEIKQTNKDYVIIEEFINGIEIGVDLFVNEGKIMLFCPHDKLVYNINGVGVPAGHILPYQADEALINRIREESEKLVKAYNIKSGAINIDAIVSDNKNIYILEAGARSGATGIPEIITTNTGIDYYELIIKSSLNEKIDISKELSNYPCASLLLYSIEDRIYQGYECKNINDIKIDIDYNIGHKVFKMKDGTDRIGMVLIKGETKKEVKEKIDIFMNNFKLE